MIKIIIQDGVVYSTLLNFSDFVLIRPSFEFTSIARSDCITFGILDDDIIEGTERITITLVRENMEVVFEDDTATILIVDNDSKTYIEVYLPFLLCI